MYAKLTDNAQIEYPPHNCGSLMNCHLNAEWLAENGYEDRPAEWFAAHAPAAPPAVRRFSTLKLHDAVGHEAWQRIVGTLTEEEQTRLALAQELATDDKQFSTALETLKAAFPNAEEILQQAEVL